MSLILDALRKSEAERRRGQVPHLHTEPAPSVQPARDGPPVWLWMALGLAAAVVLALVLWLVRSMLTVPPGVAGEGGSRAHIDATVGSPDQHSLADAIAPIFEPGVVATAPSVLRTTPPEPLVRTEPVSAPRQPAADDTTPFATPTSEGMQSPSAPRTDATAVDRPVPAPPAIARPAQEIPAAIAVAPAPVPAPTEPTRTSPIPAAAIAQPGPMLLSDLSVAQREQLPPLRMSMHLWAPTQRFAIIDGTRVSEGDRIGDAVVEEVTANGVVLAWQGHRLHIPVR